MWSLVSYIKIGQRNIADILGTELGESQPGFVLHWYNFLKEKSVRIPTALISAKAKRA